MQSVIESSLAKVDAGEVRSGGFDSVLCVVLSVSSVVFCIYLFRLLD